MSNDIPKQITSLSGGTANPISGAQVGRTVVYWRTVPYGYVSMYINPQQIEISNKKIASFTRTKAGFVYQYGGEDLTNISINGTTGSSGIEGINVLEAVYRSEQAGFDPVAQQFDTVAQLGQLAPSIGTSIDPFAAAIGTAAVSNIFEQPTPTLASMAASVEMIFQNVTYRGFFTEFRVTERADTQGLFDYAIGFTAYAKFGQRTNFMPWHRTPASDARGKDRSIGLSFGDVQDAPVAFIPPEETPTE